MPKTKPVTRQKVQAVLRKAGMHAAKFHRSGRIRGWGSWSEGYLVEARTDGDITIQHQAAGPIDPDRRSASLELYRKAMEDAGIVATLVGNATLTITASQGDETR